MVGAKEGNQMT